MKIADSSCLVCVFEEINRPYILLDWIRRGYQIILTEEVYNELKENEKTISKVQPEIVKGNIRVQSIITQEELNNFRVRYPILGKGESSVILTALKLNDQKRRYYAVLDDDKARKVAAKLGVNLTGTYGLLKKLKEKGYLDEKQFNLCKQDMGRSKFRIDFDKIK
jgi:predicted nucleic acid-binding protein